MFAGNRFGAGSLARGNGGDKGPMPRTEDGARRAAERARDRGPMIEAGVKDLADTIAEVKSRAQCNGRVGVVGLCYGGPFAILGPARLGCDAGVSIRPAPAGRCGS